MTSRLTARPSLYSCEARLYPRVKYKVNSADHGAILAGAERLFESALGPSGMVKFRRRATSMNLKGLMWTSISSPLRCQRRLLASEIDSREAIGTK